MTFSRLYWKPLLIKLEKFPQCVYFKLFQQRTIKEVDSDTSSMGNTTSNRIGNGANENNVEHSTTVVSEQCAQCGSAQSARLSLLSLNKLNSDTSRSGSIGGSYSGSHKEHKRFGSVTIKMTTSSTPNNRNRRILDQPVVTITHKISPKVRVLHHMLCPYHEGKSNISVATSLLDI